MDSPVYIYFCTLTLEFLQHRLGCLPPLMKNLQPAMIFETIVCLQLCSYNFREDFFLFQLDKEMLFKLGVTKIEWSMQCPELNPIKHLVEEPEG